MKTGFAQSRDHHTDLRMNIRRAVLIPMILAGSCIPPLSAGQAVTVAIGEFRNETDLMYIDSWGRKIEAFLAAELSRHTDISVVERQELKSLIDEKTLDSSGLTDPAGTGKAASLLSAQYIVTGVINKLDRGLRIDARIIDTGSGKTVTEKVQAPMNAPLEKMTSLLASNIHYQLTGSGRPVDRMRLHRYPAAVCLAGTSVLAASALAAHLAFLDRRSEYRDAARLEDFDPLHERAERTLRLRNGLSIASGIGLVLSGFFLYQNSHADEITACEPRVVPYAFAWGGRTWTAGIHVSF